MPIMKFNRRLARKHPCLRIVLNFVESLWLNPFPLRSSWERMSPWKQMHPPPARPQQPVPLQFETATRCSTSTEPQVIEGERNWEKFYRKYETTWNMKWMEKNCNVISKRKNNSKFDWFELTFYFSLLFVHPFIHSFQFQRSSRCQAVRVIVQWRAVRCAKMVTIWWVVDWVWVLAVRLKRWRWWRRRTKRWENIRGGGWRGILNGEWHWHWLEIWDSRNIFY